MPDDKCESCHLAWHVTSMCNLSCRHCLRNSPAHPVEDLATTDCQAILRSFVEFARSGKRPASLEFSGGNPLLREDFNILFQQAAEEKHSGAIRHIRLLGNPETITEKTVAMFVEGGLDRIVISLDGTRSTNDRMRGAGNYDAALSAIRKLIAAGIRTSIKFTLMRENADEVVDVLNIARMQGVEHVGVGHLIPAGGGYALRNHRLTPPEYRTYLLKVLRYFDHGIPPEDPLRTTFLRETGLYPLLFHELGRIGEYFQLTAPQRSASRPEGTGRHLLFVVWSDGEVVLRREFARLGYVPRASFQAIYDSSSLLHLLSDRIEMRRLAKYSQRNHVVCCDCPVAESCLPQLMGFFSGRAFFAPSPDCWRITPPLKNSYC